MVDNNKQKTCYFCLRSPIETKIKIKEEDRPSCTLCFNMLQIGKNVHGQNSGIIPERGIFAAQIDEILPQKLYLGNYEGSLNLDMLNKNKITHILVAGNNLKEFYQKNFIYKTLELNDALDQDIKKIFDQTNEFIEQGKTVFVHCFAGSSRSATIVIAYLMQKYQWSLEKTYEFVKQKRSKIHPNANFKKQLVEYENQLNKPNQAPKL